MSELKPVKGTQDKWAIHDDRRLLMLLKEGKKSKELAAIFNRSIGGIKSRIRLLTFSKSPHFKAVRKSILK